MDDLFAALCATEDAEEGGLCFPRKAHTAVERMLIYDETMNVLM